MGCTRYCTGCGRPLAHSPPVTCEHCGTSHWLDPKPCAGALVVDEGRLLLVRRAHDPWRGYWDVPGGFCETKEHPILTAQREVREETGLEIEITGLLGIWMDEYRSSRDDGERKTTLNIYYHARLSGEPRLAIDPKEVVAVAWFDPKTLPNAMAFPRHARDVLLAWKQAFRAGQLVTPLLDRPAEGAAKRRASRR